MTTPLVRSLTIALSWPAAFAVGGPGLNAPFGAAEIEAERNRLAREEGLARAIEAEGRRPMVLVPAGTFLMGSTPEAVEQAFRLKPDWVEEAAMRASLNAETPAHRVTISRPFYLGVTPVTVGEFRRFVESTGYRTTAETDGVGGLYYENGAQRSPEFTWRNPRPGFRFGDDAPVTQVTPADAEAYCQWLTESTGVRHRLPTEAEWEFAARAGTTTLWFFGDDAGPLAEYARQDGPPLAVGTRKPNPFGLHDVYGLVWEWSAEAFDAKAYGPEPRVDPAGPATGPQRARRGGAFATSLAETRSAYRKGSPQNYRGLHVGFRIVREAR